MIGRMVAALSLMRLMMYLGARFVTSVFSSRIFINLLIIPVVKSSLCHLNNLSYMFNFFSECQPGSVDC